MKKKSRFYNPEEALKNIKNQKDGLWINFINDIVYEKKPIYLPPEENIANVLLTIQSNQTINKIVRELQLIPKYNPYKTKIPLYLLSENTRNLLIRKQNYISRHWNYNKELNGKYKILVIYNKRNEKDLEQYDFVILFRGEYIEIRSKDKNKLDEIYQNLATDEPDTWVLKKSKIVNIRKSSFNVFNTLDIANLF